MATASAAATYSDSLFVVLPSGLPASKRTRLPRESAQTQNPVDCGRVRRVGG